MKAKLVKFLPLLLLLASPGIEAVTRPEPGAAVREYIVHDADVIALVGASVIDGSGAPLQRDQTVILRDGLIESISPAATASIPANAKTIAMQDMTLIPGIVGTHNHTHMPGNVILQHTAPRLYLASGVTTIQTTGSAAPYVEMNLARAIERGLEPGPQIIHSGPYMTGPDGNWVMTVPESEKGIHRFVDYWADQGVTWFKAYRHIRPRDLAVLIAAAHSRGAQVTGHLCSVTYEEAAEMGIDAIEHGFLSSYDHARERTPGICSGDRDYRSTLDIASPEVKRIHRILIERGVALSTTPAILEAQSPHGQGADKRTLAAMSPAFVRRYENQRRRMQARGENWYFKPSWLERSLAYDLAFFRAGGLLTAGPDPGLHNLPGFGDQRNFELFVEAGFTIEEALQVMTSNGARSLGLDDVGRIAPGMRANIVVLEGDLAADSTVIRNAALVFKDGYAYDPRRLLADVQEQVGIR